MLLSIEQTSNVVTQTNRTMQLNAIIPVLTLCTICRQEISSVHFLPHQVNHCIFSIIRSVCTAKSYIICICRNKNTRYAILWQPINLLYFKIVSNNKSNVNKTIKTKQKWNRALKPYKNYELLVWKCHRKAFLF